MEESPKKNNRTKLVAVAAKYSTMAMKMGIIIGGLTYLGDFLDQKYTKGDTPWWTLVCSLFGVFVALYTTLKELLKEQKDD